MLSIGSLFSGAGGLDMAVEQVFGGKVSWQCELEILHDEKGHPRMNPAGKVLRHRFPDAPNLGDITSVNWAAIPPVDVLCGGSRARTFLLLVGVRASVRKPDLGCGPCTPTLLPRCGPSLW